MDIIFYHIVILVFIVIVYLLFIKKDHNSDIQNKSKTSEEELTYKKHYHIIYLFDKKFKKIEQGLKKCNMLVYKKLKSEYYPSIENGNFIGKQISKKNEYVLKYELNLPNDSMFSKVYGDCKLIYSVYPNEETVVLETIEPEDILLECSESELTFYKEVMTSKKTPKEDMFKIDLRNKSEDNSERKDTIQNINDFTITYFDEKKYRRLERSLRKYNMLAYKKLVFEYYPNIENGNFIGKRISKKNEHILKYELKLPTDLMFSKIHGDIKLMYSVNKDEKTIVIETIEPEHILLDGYKDALPTYKGVMISKNNPEKDMFKINLLNMLKNDNERKDK